MAKGVFRIIDSDEYRLAGENDLVEMLPIIGQHPLFIEKHILEKLVYGIVNHEFVHISGPTGSAKSSLIEALYLVPDNFNAICTGLGYTIKPLKLFPIEMATYETPGELYHRRSLQNGSTFDEKSKLVDALEEASKMMNEAYPLIWLREIGRVHSSSIQGGLLNLMTKGDIVLPDGTRFEGGKIGFVADSNYQAEHSSTHTLVTLDDALKRRFTIQLALDYLSEEQEEQVLLNLFAGSELTLDHRELIRKIVMMGSIIRRHRTQGNLTTLVPPTLYTYHSMIRMAQSLPHFSLQQVAMATLLGNAGDEDKQHVSSVFNEVFGIQVAEEYESSEMGHVPF